VVWGLVTLWAIEPRVMERRVMPQKDFRRILIALDCSPSMHLVDAGPALSQRRNRRAGDVLMSVIDRVNLDQAKVTIVAFYTTARPVVVDCVDPAVVRNVLNDLPLDQAFELGKTDLFAGIRLAFDIASTWRAGSTTLFVVTDGETIPPSGMPRPPAAIAHSVVLGVGNPRVGKYIDGHQSRQDSSTLRQLAARLGGEYLDCNAKHLPRSAIFGLSESLPVRDDSPTGMREAAVAAVAVGALIVALTPLALAFFGSQASAGVPRPKAERVNRSNRGAVIHA
jgi:Ca-activated chloride channel family protein